MYAVILAGGRGTRLWPRSRNAHPKQFSDITGGGRTMLQATADRLQGLVKTEDMYVMTGRRYAALTLDQLPSLPDENILAEPFGRNTAPAIGLACRTLLNRDPQALVAIIPADHVIPDVAGFQTALRQAALVAQAGYLVTLGITPDSPHTGYGYIRRAERLDFPGHLPVYGVERFLEKPDEETATAFLAAGGYYWNGGIFICRADVMMAELQRQRPQMAEGLETIGRAMDTRQYEDVLAQVWEQMENVSIDYAVMEKARKVAMTPLDAGWNDMGSWDALEKVLDADENANRLASGKLIAIHSQGNIVYSNRLVALVGMDDIVVVDTGDALLIGRKDQMQDVKQVVDQLTNSADAALL